MPDYATFPELRRLPVFMLEKGDYVYHRDRDWFYPVRTDGEPPREMDGVNVGDTGYEIGRYLPATDWNRARRAETLHRSVRTGGTVR